jgi:hypothetical protein
MDEFLKSWKLPDETTTLKQLIVEFQNSTGKRTFVKLATLVESLALYGFSIGEGGKIVKMGETLGIDYA